MGVASWMNRLFSVAGEGGPAYNRSDGLVKQSYAQIPGAYRTFVHKCHGGYDSLVTSREAYEIATRFFFGNVRARLRLVDATVQRGGDWFGKSDIFFGVSVKPRQVDFELFHQSPEAENCYGPFSKADLTDPLANFTWADPPTRLIWEGFLDASRLGPDPDRGGIVDMVIRIDIYVGERDKYGVGFSDNVIFRKQYHLRAVLGDQLTLFRHTGEQFMQKETAEQQVPLRKRRTTWSRNLPGGNFKCPAPVSPPLSDSSWTISQRTAPAFHSASVLLATGAAGVSTSAMPSPSSESAPPGA